ncbi:MAG: phosphotransferase [Mangrovicoccus sp.]|nr:phosphotransferase [Mangrovicoccus sp.]
MGSRETQIREFLHRAGWDKAQRAPLAGDASNRRYERLRQGPDGQGAVLMDADPAKDEDTKPFVAIAQHLAALGFSAPQILAEENSAGLLLLEDLGDDLYARVIAAGSADETELYQAAIDVLIALHRHPAPQALPPYDPALMAQKAALAGQWYAGGSANPARPDADHPAATAIAAAITPLLNAHASAAPVLIQRDYHAENLLWLPARAGIARVGLLDFQDALAGHQAYDLVSLLEDARRDVPDALQEAMLAYYIAQTGQDPAAFRRAYALLGAQRNLRILGVFARLSLHYGKAHYVDLIPRVWGHLQHDLTHPDLAPLADCVAQHLPAPEPEFLERLKSRCATIPTP